MQRLLSKMDLASRDSTEYALGNLAASNFFALLAAEVVEDSIKAVEGVTDDVILARTVRDALAIKQYLMRLQSEAIALGAQVTSDIGAF